MQHTSRWAMVLCKVDMSKSLMIKISTQNTNFPGSYSSSNCKCGPLPRFTLLLMMSEKQEHVPEFEFGKEQTIFDKYVISREGEVKLCKTVAPVASPRDFRYSDRAEFDCSERCAASVCRRLLSPERPSRSHRERSNLTPRGT